MKHQKIMLATFLEPVKLGQTFRMWPLHITLVPWIHCDDVPGLLKELKNVCRETPKIEYTVGNTDFLGVKKNTKVSLIKHYDKLNKLHLKLLNIVKNYDSHLNRNHLGTNYLPHITHKRDAYPNKEDKHIIEKIYLIKEIDKKSGLREVVDCILLK